MKIILYSIVAFLLTGCGTTFLVSGNIPFLASKPFYFNLQLLDNSKINPELAKNESNKVLFLSPDTTNPPEPRHTTL